MRLRHTLLPILVLLLATCGKEPTAPTVSSVEVTPSEATLESMGATLQFSARALDSNGDPVSGETVSWSSDDDGVASVSTSGLATAQGTGVATIRATAAGVTGTALLTVLLPAQECVDPATVSLAPGEHTTFGSQDCFVLPSGDSGDLYRVALFRPDSGAASNVVDATLSVTGLGVTSAPARATAPSSPRELLPGLPAPVLETLERSIRLGESTARFHQQLRAQEARMLERLPGDALLPSRPARAPARAAAAPDKIHVDPSTACDPEVDRDEHTAILVHQSAELAIYQDSAQRTTKPITEDQARRMAEYYHDYGKGVIESYFGRPTDIDGNGFIYLVASPVINDDKVAAFVWSGDFFGQDQCPDSNEGEYIFFSSNLIRNLDSDPENDQALETVVHEAKHVVSLYNRIRASINAGNVSRFQPLWVEEGTAEIAGNLSSRVAMEATGGVGVGDRLDVHDLTNDQGKLQTTPENYGVFLRLLRTVRYLSSQPNGLVVSPDGALPDHSIYGTGWNFHRWLGDAYGNAASSRADSTLFRQLADSLAAPGPAGMEEVTGKTFKELLEEFVLAVSLHGTDAPQPPHAFTSYDFMSATDILCRPGVGNGCPTGVAPQPDGLYPWPVTEQSGEPGTTVPAGFQTAAYTGPIGPTGIRIHDFRSNGTGEGAQVEVNMRAPGKILVVRLR
jgi:hypothetical protein